MTAQIVCPICGAASPSDEHRLTCPNRGKSPSEWVQVEPPNPRPEPTREKFRLLLGSREQGVVTSVFDLEVPVGFNPAAMMVEVRGSGYFMPPSMDVWIPADMILGIARLRDEKQVTESKVLPFKVVEGGKDGTPETGPG